MTSFVPVERSTIPMMSSRPLQDSQSGTYIRQHSGSLLIIAADIGNEISPRALPDQFH
jgi:hypothetical protein